MVAAEVIRIELWDRATWRGVAFGYGDHMPPFMALVFGSADAGQEIFQHWRTAVGPEDRDERIRVSIIEGDIPGEEAGYTVHIGPNAQRFAAEGPILLFATRIHRMNPVADSPHLAGFKRSFQRHKRYRLVCGAFSPSGELLLNRETPIWKTAIALRHVSEIQTNDPDLVILAKPHRETRH